MRNSRTHTLTRLVAGLGKGSRTALRLVGGASLAVLASLLPPAVAHASDPAPAPASSLSDPQSAMQLSEIVVTAQKRPERALTTPIALTAVSQGALQRMEAVQLADYQALVPGLQLVSDREGQTQIVIRGITTGPNTPTAMVSTYVDDSPYGSTTAFALGNELTPDIDPGDLQRIEVLRGPQGTLYGASALGGLVKYVTIPPDPNVYAGRLEVDGSSVDRGGTGYGVRGMANIPLVSDTLALRVNGYDRTDPGYIDNQTTGRSDVNSTHVSGGRASLLWNAASRLSVRVTALLQDLRGNGSNEVDVDGTTLKPLYGDLVQRRYIGEPLDIQYRLYSATVNYDLGWGTLTSITSYGSLHQSQITDLTDTYQPVLAPALRIPDLGLAFNTPIGQHKITQEIRIAAPSVGRLDLQGGLYFTHERSSHGEQFDPFVISSNTPIPLNLLSGSLESSYTEYAAFGDVTYHFTSRFDVQGGLRYSANKQDYSQPESGLLIGPTTTLYAKSSDHSATFLVTPRYRLNENNMVYMRIASGYRPGGPNALTPAELAAGVPTSFKPDTLTNYEVGYKAALWQRRLILEMDVFHIDWRNIQLQTLFEGFDATGNGGAARSDGFEAAATLSPLAGLNLTANVAYTNARLTQDASGVDARSGDELPSVPRWAAHLGADYDFPIVSQWSGFAGVGASYVGARTSGFVSGAPLMFVRPVMPHYTTADLHVGAIRDEWTVEVYAKNIGNSRGIGSLSSLAFDGHSNPDEASIIQPRTIGFSVAVKF